MKIIRISFAIFSVLILVACGSRESVLDSPSVEIEFTSAPLKLGNLHEFRVEVSVTACQEQLDALPEAGWRTIQAALDETVTSVGALSELYSDDLADKVRTAVNSKVETELAKEVRVNQVLHTEFELTDRPNSG